MSPTDDAPSAARAASPLATLLISSMTIGGIAYMAITVTLAAAGRQPLPMWAHNSVLAALIIGAMVCCTVVLRQAQNHSDRERQADAHRIDREIQATYDVLARRLRDYGQQIVGVREAVAGIRGQDDDTRRAVASCVAELAAVREVVGQLVVAVPEALDAATRRGLIAGAQQAGGVPSIKDRIGVRDIRP